MKQYCLKSLWESIDNGNSFEGYLLLHSKYTYIIEKEGTDIFLVYQ